MTAAVGILRRPAAAGCCALFALASAALFGATPADALSPAGRWRFDEGAGPVARDSGSAHLDGTLSGGDMPAWIPGVDGTALHFDGGGEVVLPDAPALEPARISVAAWVRHIGSPGSYRYVVAKGASGCFRASYGLYTARNGGAAFYVSGDGFYAVSASAAARAIWDGRWHRLAGTYDGSRLRLYLDGEQVGGAIAGPTHVEYGLASTAPYVGAYHGSCKLPFEGDIDDVTIWDAGLTAAQAFDDAHPAPLAQPVPPSPPSGPVGPAPGGPPPGAAALPGFVATPPNCTSVRVSRRSVRVGRRARVVVSVKHGKRRVRRARVLVRANRLHRVQRTDRRGRASFVVRARRTQRRLAVQVLGHVSAPCGRPVAYVRVRR
jgi:hypothetical protein